MKILILGGSGFVGSYLKKELELDNKVDATSRSGDVSHIKFDIKDDDSFGIFNDNYDVVIDCIVEYKLEFNYKLNSEILGKVKILSLLLHKHTHYIAISSISACKSNKNLSDYNFTKFLSDEVILHYASLYDFKYTILRFPQIFDYHEKAKKNQGALYYFVESIRSNKTLNVFGNADLKRSYIPIEVLVKVVRKTIEDKITGTHNVIMSDIYSGNDLINIFTLLTDYSSSNLNYDPTIKIMEYSIPTCSKKFNSFLANKSCLPYFERLILKNEI